MQPTGIGVDDTILDSDDPEILPLSVQHVLLNGETPYVLSCWKADADELEEINKTGRIYIMCMGHSQPPMIVLGIKPLKGDDESKENDENESN